MKFTIKPNYGKEFLNYTPTFLFIF